MAMDRSDPRNPPISLASREEALQTPELLQLIVASLDPDSLPAAARVSKLWSEVALDEIWRECRNLKALLSILSPIVWDETLKPHPYRFTSRPSKSGWARFKAHYAPRVRILHAISLGSRLHASVFEELALANNEQNASDEATHAKGMVPLLPNLQQLTWNGEDHSPLGLCAGFMHPGVTTFQLNIPIDPFTSVEPSSSDSLFRILPNIACRMPNIVQIELNVGFHVSSGSPLEAELVAFGQRMGNLEEVSLGSANMTTAIGKALSGLERLKKLSVTTDTMTYDVGQYTANPDILSPVLPPLINVQEGEPFSSLEWLSLTASTEGCTKFLRYFSPLRLAHLDLCCASVYDQTSPSEMYDLFLLLAEICPLTLGYLSCEANGLGPWGRIEDGEELDWVTVNFAIIKPLLRLTELTTLVLRYNYPVALTDADLETLVSHLRRLEILDINPQPDVFISIALDQGKIGGAEGTGKATSLSMDALLIVAEYCPNMRSLGILLDTTLPSLRLGALASLLTSGLDDLDSDEEIDWVPTFNSQHFERLSIGLSMISDLPGEVALIEGCLKLVLGIPWPTHPEGGPPCWWCELVVGDIPDEDDVFGEGEEEREGVWIEADRRKQVWYSVKERLYYGF